jgi:hypothetical protein
VEYKASPDPSSTHAWAIIVGILAGVLLLALGFLAIQKLRKLMAERRRMQEEDIDRENERYQINKESIMSDGIN